MYGSKVYDNTKTQEGQVNKSPFSKETILTIESLKDYIEKVSKISDSLEEDELYFRGEATAHEHLTPTIYREPELLKNSKKYYNYLRMESPQELNPNTTIFDELTYLQHYGAKTRLLDVTSSPLVALFFALDSSQDDEPAYVFVFGGGEQDYFVKPANGHTASLNAAINFMEPTVVTNFIAAMRDDLSPVDFLIFDTRSTYKSYKQFYTILRDFETLIGVEQYLSKDNKALSYPDRVMFQKFLSKLRKMRHDNQILPDPQLKKIRGEKGERKF